MFHALNWTVIMGVVIAIGSLAFFGYGIVHKIERFGYSGELKIKKTSKL